MWPLVWCFPHVGSWVLGRSPKWQRIYSDPFEVVRQVNAVNYITQSEVGHGGPSRLSTSTSWSHTYGPAWAM